MADVLLMLYLEMASKTTHDRQRNTTVENADMPHRTTASAHALIR